MKGQIVVMDDRGERIGQTFERRAMQLVSKNRAKWANSEKTTIILNRAPEKELDEMDTYETIGNGGRFDEIEKPLPHKRAVVTDSGEDYDIYDDSLYKMAQERVRDRFHLVMHWAAYVSVGVFGALLVSSVMWSLSTLVSVVLCGWGIGLFLHTVFFFAKVTPHKIRREYNRLSKRR